LIFDVRNHPVEKRRVSARPAASMSRCARLSRVSK
jgi:hypothetical protein